MVSQYNIENIKSGRKPSYKSDTENENWTLTEQKFVDMSQSSSSLGPNSVSGICHGQGPTSF